MELRNRIAEVMNDRIYEIPKCKVMEFHLKLGLGSVAADVWKIKHICGAHAVEVCEGNDP